MVFRLRSALRVLLARTSPAPRRVTTYQQELDSECLRLTPLICTITMLAWLPYPAVDRAFQPDQPLIPWLRWGAAVIGVVSLLVYLLERKDWLRLRYPGLTVLGTIEAYFLIATALITGLSGGEPAYMGGYCLVIMSCLFVIPTPIGLHIGLLALSAAAFFGITLGQQTDFSRIDRHYSLTDLTVAYLLGIILVYLLNRLRRDRYEQRCQVQTQTDLITLQNAQLAEQEAQTQAALRTVRVQADRLSELDRQRTHFFANLSHEFRTPLTLLMGPIEAALGNRYGGLPERLRERLTVARRNGQRLLRLVEQLLDLAQVEAGRMPLNAVPADVVMLVRDVTHAFQPLAERHHLALRFATERSAIPTALDRDKVEKILTNLLSNAFKFTPPGGQIDVRLDMIAAPANRWRLSVTDSGSGIAAEHLPRLFDRFYQVDDPNRRGRGTGIGLSLVQEFVELHGGTVHVESTPGHGSRFTVEIPVRVPEPLAPTPVAGSAPAAEPPTDPAAAPGELTDAMTDELIDEPTHEHFDGPTDDPADDARTTVLVVDDHPDLRTHIRDQLMPQYRVVEACNGRHGLQLAHELQPDLVLADVMMPEMDGLELCRRLREARDTAHLPVILLTARAGFENRLDGLRAGADDYLLKPFDGEELRTRIHNQIAGRQRLRELLQSHPVAMPTDAPSAESVGDAPEEDAWLRTVRPLIENHLADPAFGIEEMADRLYLSRSVLQRRMRAATGQSPVEWLRQQRLARAAKLLEDRAGTVTEICYAVGFSSMSYFAKTFRAAYGVAPSDYLHATARS